MYKRHKNLFLFIIIVVGVIAGSSAVAEATNTAKAAAHTAATSWFAALFTNNDPIYHVNQKTILKNATNLDKEVLTLALKAYKNAATNALVKKSVITIVDYTLPSSQPRMWVIDLKKNQVKHVLHVAHGKGSGLEAATTFSNAPATHKSSIGVFVTGETYSGRHGESLYLHGLERDVNHNAYKRSIVMHGARYVSPEIAARTGRLGRSFGCFAINQNELTTVVQDIKDGGLLFAYYPDRNWLQNSQFLN
jgi:hypothetical protein